MKISNVNILIIGGSGFWSEMNHYPAILALKKNKFPVKVIGICDLKDPYREKNKKNLKKILSIDNPLWINPSGKRESYIIKELDILHRKNSIHLAIISTNPVHHYFYAYWGTKNEINILSDKPLVVNRNSSFDLKEASQIYQKYLILKNRVERTNKRNKSYIFCSPLRRRALDPFIDATKNLSEVYLKTKQGIRHMNVLINNGINKYPLEFLGVGAHGYHDGVGSLSHSSYHYIDIIAWCLSVAKGDISKIEFDIPYVFRVEDYIKIKGYSYIQKLIETSDLSNTVKLTNAVLNSELDFSLRMKLLDHENNLIGLVSYTNNHTSYTPRLVQYSALNLEYANESKGGRMSQVYFDIHQGAVQNLQLIKNDVAFTKNNIELITRRHPKLGKDYEKILYRNAYQKSTTTIRDLVMQLIKKIAGEKVEANILDKLSTLSQQDLTNKLFSKFYEKIAQEYHLRNKSRVRVTSTIEI